MKRSTPTYILTPHLCRHCGTGRVLQQTNSGPTGGGNSVYRCASCETGGSGIGTNCICHCGAGENYAKPCENVCVPADKSDAMKEAGWSRRILHYGLTVWRRWLDPVPTMTEAMMHDPSDP